MIRIIIQRSTESRIMAFSITGHAEYDESGKDIVCAGVSAVSIGTVNAIEALLQVQLESTMNKGLLSVVVPEITDETLREKTHLILDSMVVMLETIQKSYSKYISIKNK
jgi:uncharacterized protein YsxB (DUF464 family)